MSNLGRVAEWIDLLDPSEEELQSSLPGAVHDRALERLRQPIRHDDEPRPTIESHGDYVYAVFIVPVCRRRQDKVFYQEIDVLATHDVVLTVRKTPAGDRPFDETPIREEVAKNPNAHPGRIVFFVLDAVAEAYLQVVDELDDEIDELEDAILTDPQPAALQQAITMKRQLVQLRKIVHPQRDMFAALLSGRYELPGMTEEHERYFRDVYDHLIRVAEQLDDYRDLASGVTDLYQSTVGNKMNLTMKQLGWVATFFLPLSFLTGFFGQNFSLLAGNYIVPGWTFWVLGIGLDLAAFAAVLAWYVNRERGNLLLRVPELPALPHRR